MNISADTLDYINSLQNNLLGGNNTPSNVTPLASQSASRNLANAAVTPFQNASNNFTKTYNDITQPVGGVLQSGLTDYSDLYNLKHNTFGGQGQKSMQTPKLSDEHLGPANSNGVRPVLPSGYDQLKNFGIGDNMSLLSPQSTPSANMGIQPPVATKQSNPLGSVAAGAAKDSFSSSSAASDAAGTAAGAEEGEGLGTTLESLLELL